MTRINFITKEYGERWSLEWLETNGLGGWASSTVSGANTRRYHGLLVAATRLPIERVVLVSKLEETIVLDDAAQSRISLSTNQFPGVLHPHGYEYVDRFDRGLFPEIHFSAGDIEIKKTIAAVHGENTTLVVYEIVKSPKPFTLELLPLYAARDVHALSHFDENMNQQFLFSEETLRVKNYVGYPEIFIQVPGAVFNEEQRWYYNFEYVEEQRRGMDYKEDLYSHGKFLVKLKEGDKLGVILATDDPTGKDALSLLQKEEERRMLLQPFEDPRLKQLVLAADQFVVRRGQRYRTIIAGYHWFTDWGRDTMIGLPGLCLVAGRYEDAKKIILWFAENVSEGMLPNRFPNRRHGPEYNTIDGTLWFFYAIYKFYLATGDKPFVSSLLPLLEDIIEWHYRGTRYNIRVDKDGLITGGTDNVQLTWMDGRQGDWGVTQRNGKAVEVNALWYNALCIMGVLTKETGNGSLTKKYTMKARMVQEHFVQLFWNNEGYLYDYIDGEYKNDDIRPNQLYAISLPFPLVTGAKATKIFQIVASHLLTPRGLRTLSPSHKDYRPRYTDDFWGNEGGYHQGMVWSYLLGTYVDALIRVKGQKGKAEARRLIENFLVHMNERCVGSISEMFDGEPPHVPIGCTAKAWGVGEVLRVIVEYKLFDDDKGKDRSKL